MAVFVDELVHWDIIPKAGAQRYFGNGKASCHMTTDDPTLAELHRMACAPIPPPGWRKGDPQPKGGYGLGFERRWFQDEPGHPHYDLIPGKRALAIKLGAVPKSAWVEFDRMFTPVQGTLFDEK